MLTVQNLSRLATQSNEPSILSDVSLQLDAGRCAVVSGVSGAGKTQLLRSLVDLDPNEGHVALHRMPRESMAASVWRRQLCYVSAEPAWWAEYVKDHFSDLSDAKETASLFGIAPNLFDHPVAQLSTGERQRLALVRAFAIKPEILLLDEPTAALDPDSTTQVEAALSAFMGRGKSVILVTHDAAQGQRIGSEYYVMADGQLRSMDARQ